MPERYTVEDVPAWVVRRGVGHVVAGPGIGSGWARWACGTQSPCGSADIVRSVPGRVCKKCRAVLAEYRAQYLKAKK